MLGSHNLSKAAWGQLQNGGSELKVASYEMGVLFLADLELAYRKHRHFGYCCSTGSSPPPACCLSHHDVMTPGSAQLSPARLCQHGALLRSPGGRAHAAFCCLEWLARLWTSHDA